MDSINCAMCWSSVTAVKLLNLQSETEILIAMRQFCIAAPTSIVSYGQGNDRLTKTSRPKLLNTDGIMFF